MLRQLVLQGTDVRQWTPFYCGAPLASQDEVNTHTCCQLLPRRRLSTACWTSSCSCLRLACSSFDRRGSLRVNPGKLDLVTRIGISSRLDSLCSGLSASQKGVPHQPKSAACVMLRRARRGLCHQPCIVTACQAGKGCRSGHCKYSQRFRLASQGLHSTCARHCQGHCQGLQVRPRLSHAVRWKSKKLSGA